MSKTQHVVVVEESQAVTFEALCNELLDNGYVCWATHCTVINDAEHDYYTLYQAVFVLPHEGEPMTLDLDQRRGGMPQQDRNTLFNRVGNLTTAICEITKEIDELEERISSVLLPPKDGTPCDTNCVQTSDVSELGRVLDGLTGDLVSIRMRITDLASRADL